MSFYGEPLQKCILQLLYLGSITKQKGIFQYYRSRRLYGSIIRQLKKVYSFYMEHFSGIAQVPGGGRIRQKTVVAQAMEQIRLLLTSGQYKPGDRIPTEQELTERFGIGRSSIREAIKIFQHLGVLESQVPKGTFLCNNTSISTEAITWAIFLGTNDMVEIIQLRQAIEESAFRAALDRYAGEPGGLEYFAQRLEGEVQKMEEAAKAGSVEQLTRADYNFHAVIIQEGENKLFQEIYRTLYSFMIEEIRKSYAAMADLREAAADHQEMADIIRTGGREQAIIRHSAHFPRIQRLLNISIH
jgi:DNA-binding FadR family transcriptional regulator